MSLKPHRWYLPSPGVPMPPSPLLPNCASSLQKCSTVVAWRTGRGFTNNSLLARYYRGPVARCLGFLRSPFPGVPLLAQHSALREWKAIDSDRSWMLDLERAERHAFLKCETAQIERVPFFGVNCRNRYRASRLIYTFGPKNCGRKVSLMKSS